MKLYTLALILTTASLLQAEPSTVLGRIGDIEITTREFQEAIAGLENGRESALTKDSAALSQYARALLVQRLILKQALDKKWDQEPAVIAKLVRARETTLTESYLEAASTPEPGYPAESDLKEAYETNKTALLIPKSFQLAQIYIADDSKPGGPAPAKLEAVRKQLKVKNADFASIAKASSDETTSAAQGGVIGWLTESQIQPEIRAKLPKLSLGAISEPIRLADGWHILKVLDIREAHTPTFDQVRERLATQLRDERARLKRQQLLAQLLKDHPLAINEIELSKISPGTGK